MRTGTRPMVVLLVATAMSGCAASIGHDWREQPTRAIHEPVTARAVGGDVRVTAAPLGARVMSVGGNIRIHSAERYVRARSYGGNVEVGAVRGDAEIVSYGGSVRLRVADDTSSGGVARHVEITARGGDVTLYVPDAWPMRIDIDAEYFDKSDRPTVVPTITSDFPVSLTESEQWEKRMFGLMASSKHVYAKGTVGAGTHRVTIKTEGGNVRIFKIEEPKADAKVDVKVEVKSER